MLFLVILELNPPLLYNPGGKMEGLSQCALQTRPVYSLMKI